MNNDEPDRGILNGCAWEVIIALLVLAILALLRDWPL